MGIFTYLFLLVAVYTAMTPTVLQAKRERAFPQCPESASHSQNSKSGEDGSRCALVRGEKGCNDGFQCCQEQRPGRPGLCHDIDECSITGSCHQEAECSNNAGSYECMCKEGYTGDGKVTCADIDECNITGSCHQEAECSNNAGSYECMCKEGYTGDGKVSCEAACSPCESQASCNYASRLYDCTCYVTSADTSACSDETGVNGNTGTLTSPNYPNDYPNYLDLTWTIIVDQGKKVKIMFAELFTLECTEDSIQFLDGTVDSGTVLGSYCGLTAPSTFTSPGNIVTVKFETDYSYRYSGFSLTWTAVDE